MKREVPHGSKVFWPKTVMRKWLNIKSGAHEFYSDYSSRGWGQDTNTADGPKRPKTSSSDNLNLKMMVGTWNVGGNSPHEELNLRDWLSTSAPADIYVLGFQEIVPLNAGNVLGAEDYAPAAKWLDLIRQALENPNPDQNYQTDPENDQNTTSTANRQDEQETLLSDPANPRMSFSDLENDFSKRGDFDRFANSYSNPPSTTGRSINQNPKCMSWRGPISNSTIKSRRRYCLAASKQMVGLFLCVWVRYDLYRHVSNLRVSCVGTGIMGYLGNKGSVSISMTLYRTTFCFVCTHLTSGEKEGDEVRRNSDVTEILKRTRFSRTCRMVLAHSLPPETILEHDKIIWLGDLNYRLSSSTSDDVFKLLEKQDWQALLDKDQLGVEQRAGRVFRDWQEGVICFGPTYKYLTNSDDYTAQNIKSKEKRRTPAWCDRILWKGEGLKQMCYSRGDSKFSDHRPVHSLFSVLVDSQNSHQSNPSATRNSALLPPLSVGPTSAAAASSACNAKIQAEEILLQSCIDTST
ncbi:hypothetical protein V2J09_006704 [Rumex salicifolius]